MIGLGVGVARQVTESVGILTMRTLMGDHKFARKVSEEKDFHELVALAERHPNQTASLMESYGSPE